MPNPVYSPRVEKPVIWAGSSRADIKRLPAEARSRLGNDLQKLQFGREPRDWKPMSSIGPGVRELRVRIGASYRLIYVATLPEAVHVLHVFEKKSRKTARADLNLARTRLAQILSSRPRS